MEIELPDGWDTVKLGELCQIVSGNTPKELTRATNTGVIDFYKVSDMNLEGNEIEMRTSKLRLTDKEVKNLNLKLYPKGTVIFPKRGGAILTNKKRLLSKNSTFDLNIMGILPNNKVDSDFLFYWFQKLDLGKICDGSNVPQINNKNIIPLNFPLPKVAEQHQIVEKIEELFSELDKGIENLKTAQQQLKVYRQAVLKWAFEGKLTNENVGDGELPEGWEWKEFGQLFSESPQNGLYKSSTEYGSGTPIIRIDGFYEGKMVYNYDFKRVKLSAEEINRYLIATNDILVNRVNSIPYLGKCGLVKLLKEPTVFESNIMKIRVNIDETLPEYITLYLSSKKGLQELRKNAKHAVNQASINQTDVSNVLIPFCEKKEQIKIIEEIESRLSVCDKMEETISTSLQQAEALRQSILKRAFEGRLS